MSDPSSAHDFLDQPVTVLPGISAVRARQLRRLNVETVNDLLWLLPRSYADWSERTPVEQAKAGETVVLEASVVSVPALTRRGRLSWLKARLADDSGAINAIWFNQPWLASKLTRGEPYLFRGKVDAKGGHRQLVSPDIRACGDDAMPFEPVYPLTEGLYSSVICHAVKAALSDHRLEIEEGLPVSVRKKCHLATADFSLRRIHFPKSRDDLDAARRRLAFEELFLVVAGLRVLKAEREKEAGPVMNFSGKTGEQLKALIGHLPFVLTGSQKTALGDILRDFSGTSPSNRLIQGDVGSGKTAVAALAMAAACMNGYQAVLMAPTSILAQQHAETISRLLQHTLNVALLTGAVPPAKRRFLEEKVADGSIDILVGTHAVLNARIAFKNLGVCVTDEQHRFGVRQRLKLIDSGSTPPHVLVMSATPIPRTLAMILYGDLDISEMTDVPVGRQVVKTYTAHEHDRTRVENLMRREAAKGHQVFVVCPAIEENEEGVLHSAEETCRRLSRVIFPDLSVALLHGKLKSAEKKAVMQAFSEGKIHILVSTTVIEVGIDQPRATLLVVENAERFGLSQLHQLRGRVGRSDLPSCCILFSESDDPLVRRRLKALCVNNSGFAIADEDLLLRGPGDFFGVDQHGLPDFRAANLYEDGLLLREAAAVCDALLREDPDLSSPDNQCILREFRRRYGSRLARPGL